MSPFYEERPYRLGLLVLEPRSSAPDLLIGRVLDHHQDLQIEDEELRTLLDLQAAYHGELREIRIKAAQTGHAVWPTARLPASPSQRDEGLQARAALLYQEESLVSTYLEGVEGLLGEGRWSKLVGLYLAETRRELEALAPAIAAAVFPAFTLHRVDGSQVDPDADPSVRTVGSASGDMSATLVVDGDQEGNEVSGGGWGRGSWNAERDDRAPIAF